MKVEAFLGVEELIYFVCPLQNLDKIKKIFYQPTIQLD